MTMTDVVSGFSRTFLSAAIALALSAGPAAQGRGGGAPQSPQAAAPIDLTGTWVAVINEDWRWRMVTPLKGDYASVPMTPAARQVADSWDPSKDGRCEAYGAAGVMRLPTRLQVAWESPATIRIDTDAGQQTRRLVFGADAAPSGPPTLQGHSAAEWERAGGGRGGRGGAAPQGGSLTVVTTNMSGGWLRRNGVPYSASAVLTEHFDRFAAPNGDEWLVVTSIVSDPAYLTADFVTSSHFRKEPDASKFSPVPCRAS
jgi:hypothetical protein